MARELDERELSRLDDTHRDAASSSGASDLYASSEQFSGRPAGEEDYSGSEEAVSLSGRDLYSQSMAVCEQWGVSLADL